MKLHDLSPDTQAKILLAGLEDYMIGWDMWYQNGRINKKKYQLLLTNKFLEEMHVHAEKIHGLFPNYDLSYSEKAESKAKVIIDKEVSWKDKTRGFTTSQRRDWRRCHNK